VQTAVRLHANRKKVKREYKLDLTREEKVPPEFGEHRGGTRFTKREGLINTLKAGSDVEKAKREGKGVLSSKRDQGLLEGGPQLVRRGRGVYNRGVLHEEEGRR